MILRRLGNKQAIAHKIIPYFPPHKTYIEPFFGAGGMFFNKPKAKYNIVNDLDSEVFNLFQVVMNQKEELKKAFYMMPIHKELFEYWKTNEPKDNLQKALRFIFLSNFSFMNTKSTMLYGSNKKHSFNSELDQTFKLIQNVDFSNEYFDLFLNSLTENFKTEETLIYNDPPYLDADTKQNYVYNIKTWSKDDVVHLFNCLDETGCKYAVSEFDHPFILQQAKERGLNVHIIGERQNLKNRRTEILITNYKNNPSLFNTIK